MQKSAPHEVRIEVTDEEGAITLSIYVTPLGSHRYRLEEIPYFFGAGYRDIIELLPEAGTALRFSKVVEKSPFTTNRYVLPERVVESPSFNAFLERIEKQGGYWERIMGGIVGIALPAGSPIDIEEAMKAFL